VKRTSCDSPKVEVQVRLLAGALVLRGDRANGEPPALGAGHDWVRFPDLRLVRGNDIPGVCRSARDSAKVADQVRFLTGILTDGGYGVVASACDPVTVAVPDRNRLPALLAVTSGQALGRGLRL
jgi:hypothetical protein